ATVDIHYIIDQTTSGDTDSSLGAVSSYRYRTIGLDHATIMGSRIFKVSDQFQNSFSLGYSPGFATHYIARSTSGKLLKRKGHDFSLFYAWAYSFSPWTYLGSITSFYEDKQSWYDNYSSKILANSPTSGLKVNM